MFHQPQRTVDSHRRRSSMVGLLSLFTAMGGTLLVMVQGLKVTEPEPALPTVSWSAEKLDEKITLRLDPRPEPIAAPRDRLDTGVADFTRELAGAPMAVVPDAALPLPGPADGRLFSAIQPLPAGSHGVEPPPLSVAVRPGDTLLAILQRAGVERTEAHAAVSALADVYDPRRLRPGLQLTVETDPVAEQLVRLAFTADRRHDVEVVREAAGYAGRSVDKAVVHAPRYIDATVASSLYEAAVDEGMPADVLMRALKVFSWDVDFQREVHPGDGVAVYFDAAALEDGTVVGGETIHYARLTVSGRTVEAFRHHNADGAPEYYDRRGISLRKFLLRTPVDSARISSRFGMRRHPILGYSRMHKGVDFAAPTGTKIYAAGSGTVDRIGRRGGYGNYIRIRHGNGYATAYAHLSRYARGLERGSRVRQGQVIGYVGSTGRSTGPHLHFEVLKGNTQINPLKVAQPPASRLEGKRLQAFEAVVAEIDRAMAASDQETVIAARDRPDASTPN